MKYKAYYTSEGGCICRDCTGELTFEQEEELGYDPVFAISESDCYPVCDDCNQVLDYINLTGDCEECNQYRLENKGY